MSECEWCGQHVCGSDCDTFGCSELRAEVARLREVPDVRNQAILQLKSEVERLKRGLRDLLAAYEELMPEDVNPGANAVSVKARQLIGGGE